MEKNSKIFVAGHKGMVGSAIVRELQRQGYTNIITKVHIIGPDCLKSKKKCDNISVKLFF